MNNFIKMGIFLAFRDHNTPKNEELDTVQLKIQLSTTPVKQ